MLILINLLIDKVRKQLVEKVIKLADSEKDGHTKKDTSADR